MLCIPKQLVLTENLDLNGKIGITFSGRFVNLIEISGLAFANLTNKHFVCLLKTIG